MMTQAINKRRSVIGIALGAVLCALLLTGLIFMTGTQASAATVVDSGSHGDAHQWSLDSDGVLTISGTGDMPDFEKNADAVNAPWYSHVSEIKSVIISDGISKIGIATFASGEYTALTSVKIGDDVKVIGRNAFNNCSSLETVVFGSSVESIESDAFQYSGVVNIAIPDTVTSLGDRVFYGCTKLKSVTIGSGVTTFGSMTFFASSLETISIPNTVTSIGFMPFYNCSSLKSIELSSNITEISSNCFQNCGKLESIVIPDSVTVINSAAFAGCTSLKTAVIGNGVKTIGGSAFASCPALEKVVIGSSVASIGGGCFGNSTKLATVINLSSLDLKPGVTDSTYLTANAKVVSSDINGYTFTTEDGFEFFYGEDKCYLTAYTGSDASIVLPDNCKGKSYIVAAKAFQYNTATELTISTGVVGFGNYAFANMSALKSIKFNATAVDDTDMYFNTYLFSGSGTNGMTMTVGKNVTKIPAYFIMSCNLKNVAFEDGGVCESIGAYAFAGTNMNVFTVPSSVKSIGDYALTSVKCVIVRSADIAANITGKYSCGLSSAVSFCIDPSIKTIGSYITTDFSFVSNIEVDGVQYKIYSDHAHTPDSTVWTSNDDGTKTCGTCYVTGKTVTKTSGKCGDALEWSFDETSGVLTISGSGEMRGYAADTMPWYDIAAKITKVVIGEGVTSIGKNAFNNEKAGFVFTEIELPSTLISIGNYAFYDCAYINTLAVPASVTTIGRFAFRRLSGLVTLEEVAVWSIGDDGAYKFVTDGAARNALVLYKYNKVWTKLGEHVTADYTVREMGKCGADLLWTVDQNNVLTVTGSGLMYDYGSANSPWRGLKGVITEVVIGEGVTSIGNCAFYEFAALEKVTVSSTVLSIGNYAFYACKSLDDIAVPQALYAIGVYAFRKCNSLINVACQYSGDGEAWIYGSDELEFNAATLKANYKEEWYRIEAADI